MSQANVNLNLCRIFHDDGSQESVFGCGCVVKCSEHSLKIATSKRIRKLTDGELFAKFEAIQDKKVKLRVDMDGESEEKGGIAYVSFDETAFDEQGPEGITMGDPGRIEEIVCRVPLFEKFQQLGVADESKIEFYNIVKHQSRWTLQIKVGDESPRRVIKDLRDSERFHLLVVGSPILGDSSEFFGVVDFVERDLDEESLLELVYHGIQKTPTGMFKRCGDH